MRKRKNKDNQNEGIGITTIIVCVIIAVGGIYYFFSHRTHSLHPRAPSHQPPLEAPSPMVEEPKKTD